MARLPPPDRDPEAHLRDSLSWHLRDSLSWHLRDSLSWHLRDWSPWQLRDPWFWQPSASLCMHLAASRSLQRRFRFDLRQCNGQPAPTGAKARPYLTQRSELRRRAQPLLATEPEPQARSSSIRLSLDRKPFAALGAAGIEHRTAAAAFHPDQKAVRALALDDRRLIRTLGCHVHYPRMPPVGRTAKSP